MAKVTANPLYNSNLSFGTLTSHLSDDILVMLVGIYFILSILTMEAILLPNPDLLRILIIDDDEDDYLIIRDLLLEVTEVRYQIDWVDNYKKALQIINEKNYDSCLLDLRLGKYSGLELLREIVKVKYRMPVILLTGIKNHAIDVEAMNSGAVDFLIKGEVNAVILERSIRYSIERKKMEEVLYNEKERVQVTLDSIGDAVITADNEGKITYLNQIATKLTGWDSETAWRLPLTHVFKVVAEDTLKKFSDLIKMVIVADQVIDFSDQALLVSRTGQSYAIEGSASPIHDRENRVGGIVIAFRDVTATREMSKKISYQASHDGLTGLINRVKFEEELNLALMDTKVLKIEHCLLYLDLDRFKLVNDTCGHLAGDQLLKQVTALIQGKIRCTDIFARMGGDEFAILLHNCPLTRANEIAGDICSSIYNFQFIYQDYEFNIGVSIGIVSINVDSPGLDRILCNADEACYLAKDKGGNGYYDYHGKHQENVTKQNELLWIMNINRAFANNLFRLHQQPLIPLTMEDSCFHYELLIRIVNEKDQLFLPQNFLPTATRYKLMAAIDRWVVKNYFAFYRQKLVNYNHIGSYICNINLSGAFLNDETSLEFLLEQIEYYQIPTSHLCFEITETIAIANFNQVIAFVEQLKTRGCSFALDDFGNGLATFNYLKNLPVDFVKIDGSFVRNILINPIDCAIVDSINQIAHLMKIKTVAEFVESEAIFHKLKEIGVDYVQGYWIDQPKPLEILAIPYSVKLTAI
jgi:diguanylate cyclase (GGDEF)-like protein/PAS domain S-box-containing protein